MIDVVAFINRNLGGHLATCDGGKPHVRGMWLYKADAQGLVFHTGTFKTLHAELQKNPRVELCFFDPKENIQVRVRGGAMLTGSQALVDEIITNREFLKAIIKEKGKDAVAVYRVIDCEYNVWSMADNLSPTVWRPWPSA